ncbi:MAG: hypothetical protein QXD43_05505 [Candidatus Aenigmatarchaeota archaeon]
MSNATDASKQNNTNLTIKPNNTNGEIDIFKREDGNNTDSDELSNFNFKNLLISIFPTGKSDAILLNLDNKKFILIGTGSLSYTNILDNFFSLYGVKQIDLLILPTEMDSQIGAFQLLAKKYVIDEIWKYPLEFSKQEFKDSLYIAKLNGSRVLNVNKGFKKNFSDLEISILNPDKSLLNSVEQDSLVIKLNYKKFCMLIFSESEMMIESKLKGNNDLGKCNVLKASRHGGATATSDLLIRAVEPEYILFTTDGNWDSPHSTTLERIKIYNATAKTKVNVYTTHKNGKIDISTNGIDYNIYVQNI